MRGYRVATVWGIPIRIHVSLVIILPVFAWLLGSGGQIELYAALVDRMVTDRQTSFVVTQGGDPVGLVTLDSQRASAAFVDGPRGRRVVSRSDFTDALEMRRLLGSRGPF